MMMRLNPTQEARIGFAAFSAGMLGWLKDHAAALPSPATSEEASADGEQIDDKENVAVASPLRELGGNRGDEPSPRRESPLQAQAAAGVQRIHTPRMGQCSALAV